MFEIRKYKANGRWTEWKEVSKEIAERKSKITVKMYYYDDEWTCFYPYQIREKK